jgi:hypothetical protein
MEVCQMLAALMPQLYRALEKLPAESAAEAAAVLEAAPVVWTGNGFSPTDKVAFRSAHPPPKSPAPAIPSTML